MTLYPYRELTHHKQSSSGVVGGNLLQSWVNLTIVTTGGNGEAALPTERRGTAATLQTTGGWTTEQSPYPPASHAWLASRSPHTASGQRREAIASGHENGERGCRTAIGHRDHPDKHAKATAVTGSGNSRDRSRQSDLGEAASGQKTATGHTETTRAERNETASGPKTANGRARENSKRDDATAHSVTTAQPSTESGAIA